MESRCQKKENGSGPRRSKPNGSVQGAPTTRKCSSLLQVKRSQNRQAVAICFETAAWPEEIDTDLRQGIRWLLYDAPESVYLSMQSPPDSRLLVIKNKSEEQTWKDGVPNKPRQWRQPHVPDSLSSCVRAGA